MPEIKYSFVKLDEVINKPKDATCGTCHLYPLAIPQSSDVSTYQM